MSEQVDDPLLESGEGSANSEPLMDVWSEEFRACLGAWDEEIVRPPQGRLSRSDSEETNNAV